MATKLQHTIEFPFGMAAYRKAISDPEYWSTLAVGSDKAPGELESADITDTGAKIALIQKIPADKLPSAVTSMIPGDLAIHRTVSIEFTSDDRSAGTFDATVNGAPATTSGTIEATGSEKCSIAFAGEVTVRIPLIGGKIEKMIAENMRTLFEAERDFTIAWHDEHP
ncbi:DUF2505 domain-containing protein [Williamsia herbipolensis]|uniref:DUF2505 domain-containing protein n=1 Tax=Williamsia herbipolensis TaxID=1603258 RepID=A0AAU4K030_9NOCA|nr:DUF2505 domain-containing protein [Williamsia herbipolensis]